jgi:integrase
MMSRPASPFHPTKQAPALLAREAEAMPGPSSSKVFKRPLLRHSNQKCNAFCTVALDRKRALTPAQYGDLAEVPPELDAWRKDVEARGLSPSSIRRKLSALSSLFDYLCERNAVSGNPVDGVKRPMASGNEGSTPALGDAQGRKLLEAPPADTLKGARVRLCCIKRGRVDGPWLSVFALTQTLARPD